MKSKAPATWDEAELLEVSMTSRHGTADAEALGVAGADGRRARGGLSRPAAVLRRSGSPPAGDDARRLSGRAAVGPGLGRLELRGERQQRALAGRLADELDAERQAVVVLVERQRDRRLAA